MSAGAINWFISGVHTKYVFARQNTSTADASRLGISPLLVVKMDFIHKAHEVAIKGALRVHHRDNMVRNVSANFIANLLGTDRSDYNRYVQWWYGYRNAAIGGLEVVD